MHTIPSKPNRTNKLSKLRLNIRRNKEKGVIFTGI